MKSKGEWSFDTFEKESNRVTLFCAVKLVLIEKSSVLDSLIFIGTILQIFQKIFEREKKSQQK